MLKLETVENKLLVALPDEVFGLIQQHLEPVHLSPGQSLYGQGDTIKDLYFPVNCVISAVAIMNDGATVEISLTGREGVTGVVSIFGDYTARNWTRGLIPGDALKIRSSVIREAFARSEAVQRLMMEYYRSLITQISQRAVCNGRHTVLQRLCCWLLMVQDRVGRDDLLLTQEMIANRLGSRRAGITQAARTLLASEAISYSRGKIHILDREIIEFMACECYRVHGEGFEGTKNAGANSRSHRV
jgi:CRP-like cAMP-binding protein